MNRAEVEVLLVGKTISKVDLVESGICPMTIEAIHFTDGTIAQLRLKLAYRVAKASELAMTRFLAAKAVGATFIVHPRDLQLSLEQFHAAVKGWIANGGGPGFWHLTNHQESSSGKRLYDMITVRRTS